MKVPDQGQTAIYCAKGFSVFCNNLSIFCQQCNMKSFPPLFPQFIEAKTFCLQSCQMVCVTLFVMLCQCHVTPWSFWVFLSVSLLFLPHLGHALLSLPGGPQLHLLSNYVLHSLLSFVSSSFNPGQSPPASTVSWIGFVFCPVPHLFLFVAISCSAPGQRLFPPTLSFSGYFSI